MNKKLIITIVSVVALVVLGVGVYGLSEARKKAKDPDASFVPISSEESSEEESSREKPVKPDQSRESSEESREESSIVKPEKEESSKPEKEEEEEPLPEGYVYSQYTGLPIPEEVALQTPVAVMLNNHIDAYPQSSISFADIVYEVPVEGSITRYLAVFQDYADLEKIGSIRSTRRYYLDFALDQSAVLVHFGDDESIQPIYNAIGCRHLEGMYTQYNYWRSTDRVAPHNVYTNGQSLIEALDKRGFGSKMDGPVEDPMFSFYKSEKEAQKGLDALKDVEGTIPCSHVTITYRPNAGMYIEPEYFYNEETKLYERSIYGGDQIDKETDERVTCKNIFIMITDLHPRGDSKGHMDITTIGEGKGYYICEGKAVPVIWKKESQEDTTKWYLENGDRLVMAPGKTWISILATSTPYTLE